jgi:hypothetical protein
MIIHIHYPPNICVSHSSFMSPTPSSLAFTFAFIFNFHMCIALVLNESL